MIAAELASIHKIAGQKELLRENETIIAKNKIQITGLTTSLVAMIAIILILWLYSEKTAVKNKSLFLQTEDIEKGKGKLEAIENMTIQNKNNDTRNNNQLFLLFEDYIHKNKAFLNPDITREQIASILGTNKLYLSNAIMENIALTFGGYINKMRLDYAKELLLNDMNTKIEAIALMSGFNSVRTFYRLFLKTYHMTPSEFRKITASFK